MQIKPVFTPEEANAIIVILDKKAKENTSEGDFYREIIGKIQTTTGYLEHSGIYKAGYHMEEIPRGVYGELSKVIEEAAELKDAMEQGNKLMVLIELSDIIGAIDGYLDKYYTGRSMTIDNLITMAFTTKRVFESGYRK